MGAPFGNKNASGSHKMGDKKRAKRTSYNPKHFVGGKKSADSAREFFSHMNRRGG